MQAGDHCRGVAGKRFTAGCDENHFACPPAHARLRQLLVEVGQHPQHVNPGSDALAKALDRLLSAPELLPGGQQRLLIEPVGVESSRPAYPGRTPAVEAAAAGCAG